MSVSIIILTKNEEQDLPGCLESVSWSDDVHVFDSFSDDQTIAIAEAFGAKVTQRVFDNYAAHRNASLQLSFKQPWVLVLDADERIPAALASEIALKVSQANNDVNAFRIRRRDFLFEKWLKHAQISPYYLRLFRLGKGTYKREVNEILEVEGKIEDLEEPFDHYPFSKGFSHWLDKHNRYSTMEAALIIKNQKTNEPFSIKSAFFEKDFNKKRFHQKELFYRLPFRPFIKFFYMMFIRGAILDGRAGITYSALQATYEYFIVLKTRELAAKSE